MSCVPERVLLSLLFFLGLGSFGIAAESHNEIPTWTKQGVLSGATSTKAECVRRDRVWVEDKSGGVCIRYFANGVKPRDGIGVFIFDGDYVGSDWDKNGLPIRAKYTLDYDGKAAYRRATNVPNVSS